MTKVEANGVEFLLHALEESVKLQSHYAALLNQHDGGKRFEFPNAQAWILRLVESKLGDGFARSLLASVGEKMRECASVAFSEKELQAIYIACGFAFAHMDAGDDFDATLEGVGEKIADKFPQWAEGCGHCDECKAARENMQ